MPYSDCSSQVCPCFRGQDAWQNNLQKFLVGFVAGVLGSTLNIPFDVAKSRIQGPQPDPAKPKYSSTFGAISIVYREEG